MYFLQQAHRNHQKNGIHYSFSYAHLQILTIYLQYHNYLYIQSERRITLRSEANELIGGIECLYTALILKGLYLPKRSSDYINAEYLLKVALNKVFIMASEKARHGISIQKMSKVQLYELQKKQKLQKPLGFNQHHLPDKQWMLDLLQSVNPDHEIFKQTINDLPTDLTNEEIKILKQLDTSHHRGKRMRFFRLSKLQKKTKDRVSSQVNRLGEMLQIKQKELEEAENKLKNCYIEIAQYDDDPHKMQVEQVQQVQNK